IAELERCREILACGEDGPGLAGLVARAQAVAAAARGAWRESEAQFIKAAETFRRHGMVWQEAHTFQHWGFALRAGADRRAAIEKLDTAIEIYRRLGASPAWIDGVAGNHDGSNGGNRAPAAPTPEVTAALGGSAIFQRHGDYWTLAWQGNVIRLKDSKGLHYIAYLLANPGRQVLACELAASAACGDRRTTHDPGA